MKIRVRYLGQIKLAAGAAEEELQCTAPELASALAQLAARHGPPLAGLLLDDAGRPRASTLVFVGDQLVRSPADIELTEGTVLTLATPMAGG